MKKMKFINWVIIALLFSPLSIIAQWSMVQFDNYNTYSSVFTATSNATFVIGSAPGDINNFLLRTNDAGTTWDSISFNIPGSQFDNMFFVNENLGFVSGFNEWGVRKMYKTTNNGNTWMDITLPLATAYPITSIHFSEEENGFISDGEYIYTTNDGGNTWAQEFTSFYVNDIFFFNEEEGYACGWFNDGPGPVRGVVMRSNDGGKNWTNFLDVSNIHSVPKISKLDVVSPEILFAFKDNTNKLFRTIDGGSLWDTIVATPLPDVYGIRDFDFVSSDTGHVLSYEGEIYFTSDGGQNWTLEYKTEWGLYGPSVFLNSFSFIGKIGFVVGSNGLIKKYTRPATSAIPELISGAGVSIYPNPVNDLLSINGGADFSIGLYDVSGTLVLRNKSSDQAELDLSICPSGIYFLKIIQNGQFYTEKVLKK